jgi:hypothetical protein
MKRFLTICFGLVAMFGAAGALAQNTGNAAAEALFQEGRSLAQEGRYTEACPKFAESQRLDPSTGTLIALALCHEGEGKLATAWAEFTSAEARAKHEGREDRAKLARERAAALQPRLSTLTVDVPPEVAATPGLKVKLDGAVIGSPSFGVAVPIDGGEHRLEATATGKEPFETVVTVKGEADAARVSVQPLVNAVEPAGSPPPASRAQKTPDDESQDRPGSGMRTAGLITAGAGVVALGVGSYLALDAKGDYEDAKNQCGSAGCQEGPYQAGEDARSQGTTATIVLAIGGAAVATGAVLWFVAPSEESRTLDTTAALRINRVGIGPRGLVMGGSF